MGIPSTYIMAFEPNSSTCQKHKKFCTSHLTADEMNEILQSCNSEESDTEHSDSYSYSDTDKDRN